MSRATTLRGEPLPVEGAELHAGDPATDFKLHMMGEGGLKDVSLKDFQGKTLILSVVLSLDTGVCAAQSRKFNEAASKLPNDVEVLTVSTDLPYAQRRFCGAEHLDKLKTASDHRDVSFGKAYGVLIPSLRTLMRAAFVVGPDGSIKYAEYVPELTSEPNYDAVLSAAKA